MVCYLVDVYPFKLCQVILKMHILEKLGPRNKSGQMATVYIIVPMPMLTRLSLVFTNSQAYAKI